MTLTASYRRLVHDYEEGILSKTGFLDCLTNKFGSVDVCRIRKDSDGTRYSTRWVPWIDAREISSLAQSCNNRTLAESELVLDLEEKELLGPIVDVLLRYQIDFVPFRTGSRGHHLHIFDEELLRTPRREFLKVLAALGADVQKASTRTMIALELAPHWKTGRPKEVMQNVAA